MTDNGVLMNDKFILIILIFVLITLFLMNKNSKVNYEQYQNIHEQFQNNQEQTKYFKYVFNGDDFKKYELLTFSQLNFDLQQQILNKIVNNQIIANNETFQNVDNNLTNDSNVPESSSSFPENSSNVYESSSNVYESSSNVYESSSSVYESSSNVYESSSNVSETSLEASSETPKIINYYQDIINAETLQSNIDSGSRYMPINDLLFAVRSNKMLDEKVLSYKPQLLFDENDTVNYSVLNLSRISPSIKSKLSSYNNILLLSIPNDEFNIKNKNVFESAIIKDNQISFKNVKLIQIDDLPISLIKLTEGPSNITIEKEEVFV